MVGDSKYHKSGIPLFQRTFSYSKILDPKTAISDLSKQFKKSLQPPIVFRALSTNHIMFREEIQLFHFYPSGYFPFMHDLIEIDPIQKRISIVGRAYWYLVGFILVLVVNIILEWVLIGLNFGSLIPFFLVLPVFVTLYGRAIRPYNQLVTELQQRCGTDIEQNQSIAVRNDLHLQTSQINWIVLQIIIVVVVVGFFGAAFSSGPSNLPILLIMAFSIVGAVSGSLIAVIIRGVWGIFIQGSVWDGHWTICGTIIGAIIGAIIAGVSIALVGV